MSAKCAGKLCNVCGKTIESANYSCSKCGVCICFYCGAEMLKEIEDAYLKCPRCSSKLK